VSKQKHIPALDGLRGLAVLTVILYHVGGGAQSSNSLLRTFGTLVQSGWTGVPLFFVLSGFLITGILWDSRGSASWYRNFYLRRTIRISPLYYLALSLVLLSGLAAGQLIHTASHIWVFFLYAQNIPGLNRIGEGSGSILPLSHFWSLAVEEQFYLIWPFLMTQTRTTRQMKHLCVAIFLTSLLFRVGVWAWLGSPGPFNGFILSRAGELALGAWLAMSWRESSWNKISSLLTRLSPLFLLGFIGTSLADRSFQIDHKWTFTFGLTFITLFWGSILAVSLREGLIKNLMETAWLQWVGGISYGLYVYHVLFSVLYHDLAASIVRSGNRNVVLGFSALITVSFSFLVAYASFRFFEKPILNLRRRFQPPHNGPA
jgi:peptidoglycan/LPS O-acetylase OafA/YrhL